MHHFACKLTVDYSFINYRYYNAFSYTLFGYQCYFKTIFLHHLLFKLFRKHTQWKGRGKWKEAEKDSNNRSQ